jgi:hypothetical protein
VTTRLRRGRALLVTGATAVTAAVATLTVVLVMAAYGGENDWSEPREGPSASGSLGAGFLPAATPAPESTITPDPDSWAGLSPAPGYRVVLLSYGDDDQTRVLIDAVHDWADELDVDLRTITPSDPHDLVPGILRAIDLAPDLVISVGHDLVDPMAAVTASHLRQQFLVVGAEVAEPTHNVTAADWTGASFRGEGLGMSSDYDPASFTPERAGRAVRAGVAAVLSGASGLVIWVD